MRLQERIAAPGVIHHIIVRGIEWKRIFHDDKDCNDFLDRIGGIAKETSKICYSWTLIPNNILF